MIEFNGMIHANVLKRYVEKSEYRSGSLRKPFAVYEEFCFVQYLNLRAGHYVIYSSVYRNDPNSEVASESMFIDDVSEIKRNAYLYSNVMCRNCLEYVEIIQGLAGGVSEYICTACGFHSINTGRSLQRLTPFLADVKLSKLYPRWRWVK